MKKRGKGMSVMGHSTGRYGGGDPSEARVHLKIDGTFNLEVGTPEIGQGVNTAFIQIAAEELDVPYEAISFSNIDTDVAPYCTGTFASRALFFTGNAIIKACKDLKEKMKKFAALIMGVNPDQLEMADNKIYMKDNPNKAMSMAEIGTACIMRGSFLNGVGTYTAGGPSPINPVTGEQPLVAAAAFGTCVVEVKVDTEIGVVEVLKMIHVYDVGRVINLLNCKQQVSGGAAHGIGMALFEDAHPYWPSIEYAVNNLADYVLPTAADMPVESEYSFVEKPHPDGPFGAKGFGEGTPNAIIPAIAAAIHDAVGIWIFQWPITPESILRALEAKKVGEQSRY